MKAHAPLVTVITVVKNGERYLKDALESVFTQTYQCCECVVIDGQSQDGTPEIAKSFPQVHYIQQPDQGLANARNLGIANANGEFIAFLDHDDLWAPGKLSRQIEFLLNHPSVQFTITWLEFFDAPNARPLPGLMPNSSGKPRPGWTPSALVARKELFDCFGGFNSQFTIGCDADWFSRAIDGHIPYTVITEVLLYKRLHAGNLSNDISVNRRELFMIAKQSIERQRSGN